MSNDKITRYLFGQRNVGKTIAAMTETVKQEQMPGYLAGRIDDVRTDYKLMCDIMLRSLRDDKIDDVYANLLRRLYAVAADMLVEQKAKSCPAYASAIAAAHDTDTHPDAVRTALEGFVQDMAMAAFEPEDSRKAKTEQMRAKHHAYMRRLFDALLATPVWNDTVAAGYTSLLTSPTIDTNDALLLVSAIMLAAMNVYDPYKWAVLADVYMQAADEALRQRALVGWALALPDKAQATLFDVVERRLDSMLADSKVRRQLLDMQMQLLFCCNADADNEEIRRNIMPTLLKNSNIKMTRLGIEEKEDDPMRDIMDPDAADRDMEAMEQKFKRMMEMQKAGADIYFGGFAQMKRFAFFNDLCNWFAPFFVEHPQLQDVRTKLAEGAFLYNLMADGPFCDSDKYSFALAIAHVFDRLPQQIREMVGSNAQIGPTVSSEERRQPSFICRSYVQTLYRFYRLHNRRADFVNPFALDADTRRNGLFFASPLMGRDTLVDEAVALGGFLLKRKLLPQLDMLLSRFAFSHDIRMVRLRGMLCMAEGKVAEALDLFASIAKEHRSEDVTKGMAHCCFVMKRFDEAAAHYRTLLALHPDSMACQLNLAVCLMSIDSVEEGSSLLYKLYYEHPESTNVMRAFAWCLMLQGNTGKALDIYTQLLSQDNAVAADRLNAGYAHWLTKDVCGAVSLFKAYCSMRDGEKGKAALLVDEFKNDAALLDKYGIRLSERKIMVDLVTERV